LAAIYFMWLNFRGFTNIRTFPRKAAKDERVVQGYCSGTRQPKK
jgi:hypothetical protein